jgi:hypothetical protein
MVQDAYNLNCFEVELALVVSSLELNLVSLVVVACCYLQVFAAVLLLVIAIHIGWSLD